VFFLASNDETPYVLKTFIIGLENLLSLKVKILRCDNETEFKNADLNQFCGLKGIKREFSAEVVYTACYVQNQKSVSPDFHSLICGDQTRKQGDKTENKDKGKSPVVTITRFRDLNAKFEECNNNNSNGVNAAGSLVSAAGQNYTNSTNDFSAAGPSNAVMLNSEDLSQDAGSRVFKMVTGQPKGLMNPIIGNLPCKSS
nr:hypothetical protein [Tanacetum cinerariifolium]